jgi:PAS domain S-box-containing protein
MFRETMPDGKESDGDGENDQGALREELRQTTAERDRARAALWRCEARWRGYFQLGAVGVAVSAPGKGWIEANDALCRILGYPRDELLSLTWAEITHPDDLAADEALFSRVLAGKMDGFELDKRYICKDGGVVDTRLFTQCVRASDGTPDHFVTFVMDMTRTMDAQRRLAASEAALRAQLETIEAQQHAIREMSVPLLDVWEGVVALPVIGALSSERAQAMAEHLLACIAATSPRFVLVDLTGLTGVDEAVAAHLSALCAAARLLGAQPIVTGIRPALAGAIVAGNIELPGVIMRSTMREGLALAVKR